MKVQRACLQCFLWLLAAGVGSVPPLAAQTLHIERLANGAEFVLVSQPLADATTVAWPGAETAGWAPQAVTSGTMTLVVDLEETLGVRAEDPPPVVVAVGAAPLAELRGTLDRLLPEAAADVVAEPPARTVDEGRVERRLGAPGSDVEIRLEVNLPRPSERSRTTVEVLWDLIPDALSTELSGLRTRVDGDIGILEARARAADVEMTLRRLRLGLARIADDPRLQPDLVEASAERLLVRRQSLLDRHPDAAIALLGLWGQGGAAAVREFLFGGDGVTAPAVQEAARSWLPQHPGAAVVVLPPQSFNPRFASPPVVVQLESGLVAAVLERPGSLLATVCLRPVVVPDLDDGTAAAILTRVAGELRNAPQRPGWVEVRANPPRLELAAALEGFAELVEVLRGALGTVAGDQQPVALDAGDARRRALGLMAGLLGVAEGAALSPATLLSWDNLALGVVAEDAEAAAEAVHKFWALDSAMDDTSVQALAAVPRTREAVGGSSSTLVVALELPSLRDETVQSVLADLLAVRSAKLFPEYSVEIQKPFVPGRSVLLVVLSAAAPLDAIEKRLGAGWAELTQKTSEDEIGPLRRRVAAADAAFWSGATGRARRCAGVAVGEVGWRPASEMELAVLSLSPEQLDGVLEGLPELEALQTTGAGLLPIVKLDER